MPELLGGVCYRERTGLGLKGSQGRELHRREVNVKTIISVNMDVSLTWKPVRTVF